MKKRGADRTAPEDLKRFCAEVYPRVVGAMHLFTGDQYLAEEIAQEAFFRLCREWPNLSPDQNRVGWVHTVAYNLAKSRFRRRKVQRRAQRRAEDMAKSTHANHASMPDAADVMSVRQAVRQLNDDQRAVIVLRYYAGLTVDETASTLDIPTGTVKTRTRRGIETLRTAGLTVPDVDESLQTAHPNHTDDALEMTS